MNSDDWDALRRAIQANDFATQYLKLNSIGAALDAIRQTTDDHRRITQFLAYDSQFGGSARLLSAYADSFNTARQFADQFRAMEETKTHFLRSVAMSIPETLSALSLSFATRGSLSALASIPTIDTFAAARIASLWGLDGVRRQLEALGIDWAFEDTDEKSRATTLPDQPTGPRTVRHLPGFYDVLNIIIAILIVVYQEQSSKEMEARLTETIQTGQQVTEQHIQALERVLNNVLASIQSRHERRTQFVVRKREALIRRDARDGSTVVAKVFPNQVVTLLDEQSKWIKVEYYDWVAQETRSGWALKKYFLRVHQNAGNAR